MANNSLNGLSPTLLKVLEVAKLGKAVSPSEINDHVGKGNYAAKHVLYLRILGYDFTVAKSGRNVVSYTLIKEPANAAQMVADASNKQNKSTTVKTKVPKVAKVTAPKKVAAPAPASRKVAAKKSVAAIKAANLAKLKAVGAKFKAEKKQVEYDTLTEAPSASSFSIDGDWDSVEGLDLKNLL